MTWRKTGEVISRFDIGNIAWRRRDSSYLRMLSSIAHVLEAPDSRGDIGRYKSERQSVLAINDRKVDADAQFPDVEASGFLPFRFPFDLRLRFRHSPKRQ